MYQESNLANGGGWFRATGDHRRSEAEGNRTYANDDSRWAGACRVRQTDADAQAISPFVRAVDASTPHRRRDIEPTNSDAGNEGQTCQSRTGAYVRSTASHAKLVKRAVVVRERRVCAAAHE